MALFFLIYLPVMRMIDRDGRRAIASRAVGPPYSR